MRNLLIRLFLLALFSMILSILVPQMILAAQPPQQGGAPTMPHVKEGREDCLACHEKGLAGATKVPPDHAGRINQMCTLCHAGGTAAPTAGGTPAPTTASKTPFIPHTTDGREQCLSCHQAGGGGATKVPANHVGRTNETCRGCHQPKPVVPVAVPTRIQATSGAGGQSSCVDCHTDLAGKSAEIVKQHKLSIHASRNVGCTDCHGGDATKKTKEEAMSPKAGYVGKPKTQDIPALCASCHARVDQMRQYDLATDQYAQYRESVHGIKLAEGDTNVATCFTCHDGHGTKETNDPSANVYAQNIPGLCASCHANTEMMKSYKIPTNQYDLYKKSVHGKALLEKQDPRAPSCATCHGTHGAAPPGFSEVANVCGSCHSATHEYYLKSAHANNTPGTPKCVTCHGRYDVGPASEAMFTGSGARDCGSCHTANSAQAGSVKQLSDAISAAAKAYEEAEAAIKRAAGTGLIVAPEEAKLAESKTNLITARAAQHTLNLGTVKEKTDKGASIAVSVKELAEKAMSDSVLRRQAMVIGLGVAALAIGCLYLIRRELYRQLPPKE